MGHVNGWVWCLRKRAGFNVGRFDLVLGEEDGHPGAHDFLSPPGFLCYAQHACCPHAFSFMIYTCEFSCMALRVACFAALQLAPGCLGLIAPDCRSWGTPARGTTFRNWINPMGVGYEFVVQGNRMASRNLACINQLALMHAVLCCQPMHVFRPSYMHATKGGFNLLAGAEPTCLLHS